MPEEMRLIVGVSNRGCFARPGAARRPIGWPRGVARTGIVGDKGVWRMFLNRSSGSTSPGSGKVGGHRAAGKRRAVRFFRPQVELLEDRVVPTTGPKPPPIIDQPPVISMPDQSPTPPAGAITPAQMRHAYGIDQVTFGGVAGDGTGQTIVILDAGDNPGFVSSTDPNFDNSDLHKFDQQFGLPDPPSFLKLNQEGQQGNYPPVDQSGFALEEALDVEWSHSIAPGANIILVETNDAFDANLIVAGTALAQSLPQTSVVSMSFGRAEESTDPGLNALFTTPTGHQGITYLASTGDDGAPGGFPAFSPNVVAVGGTTLNINAAGDYISESGWSGSGGGISQFETQPSYQTGVVTQSSTMRTIPDVAFDADPDTGVAVFDSFDNGASTPWSQVGGTSLACPCWAAIVAIADQDRARVGLGTLDGSTQTLPKIYSLPESDFHDITTGNNGFAAGPGYDLVTGRGTPIAQLLIPDLAGVSNFIASQNRYHPFRYIVDATLPQDGSVVEGNITVFNRTNESSSAQFVIVLGQLPDDVTLDPSVPTTTLSNGTVAIPLPVTGLPSGVAIRIDIKLDNPHHVPISTFFQGFDITLEPVF
jgi:subtilase family serine protease